MKAPLIVAVLAAVLVGTATAGRVVAIGDSLTAEYDTIPDIPGFPTTATEYAEVTVDGWEAMSWVEVLGRIRPRDFNFGGYRKLPNTWSIPRVSGYEFNWAIPGADAGQIEDFLTSSLRSNPGYWFLRQPLEDQLAHRAQRVVIWIGTNDFRGSFGAIYDGEDTKPLIDGLIDDLNRVIDFVQKKNGDLQIVVCNLPDLGATPAKKEAHPDPELRGRVTDATRAANARIAELAASKRVVVANVFAQSRRLVKNVPTFFGAVEIINDTDPDNDPRYHFARDGLHPNTASQIEIARIILDAFNTGYGDDIPQINDSEALRLLGLNPNLPFYDWLDERGVADRRFKADVDGDGLTDLVEYGFNLDPANPDADQLPVTIAGPAPDGSVTIHYTPDAARARHVRVQPQYSLDGEVWQKVPPENVTTNADGSFTAVTPASSTPVYTRLTVIVIPPSGADFSIRSPVQFAPR